MSFNLTDVLTGAENIGIGTGVLPPSTTVQPSAQTGSPSNTAPPSGQVWTGGAAPAPPPPSVPNWVWYAGGAAVLLLVLALAVRR